MLIIPGFCGGYSSILISPRAALELNLDYRWLFFWLVILGTFSISLAWSNPAG
jgi:hypothetical protein